MNAVLQGEDGCRQQWVKQGEGSILPQLTVFLVSAGITGPDHLSFSGGLSLCISQTFKVLEGECSSSSRGELGIFQDDQRVVSWSENSQRCGHRGKAELGAMGRGVAFFRD